MADRLLALLTWFSQAFPTGGFAYSAGLEWAVETGAVTDAAALALWIEDSLALGALWTDAVLLRRAYRGEPADEQALALCAGAERRLETAAQGDAFATATAAWGGTPPAAYPVAAGCFAAAQGVAEDDAVLAYLHNAVAAQISAALRLIPLGQSAGLRVQRGIEPAILATVAQSRALTLGGAAWAAEIAGHLHETQQTRLFRT